MATVIQWKNGSEWVEFDTSEIDHLSRDHAIRLFSGCIAVRAKEGDYRITNRPEIRDQYKKKGQACKLFSELQPSDQQFQYVGFLGYVREAEKTGGKARRGTGVVLTAGVSAGFHPLVTLVRNRGGL